MQRKIASMWIKDWIRMDNIGSIKCIGSLDLCSSEDWIYVDVENLSDD